MPDLIVRSFMGVFLGGNLVVCKAIAQLAEQVNAGSLSSIREQFAGLQQSSVLCGELHAGVSEQHVVVCVAIRSPALASCCFVL